MKKKWIKALALAAVLATMPVLSFAAGLSPTTNSSSSSNSSHDDDDSSSSSTTDTAGTTSSTADTGADTNTATGTTVTKVTSVSAITTSTGAVVETAAISTDTTGTTVAVVAESGTVGANGGAVVANKEISIAGGVAETAGLPESVVSTIETLNRGTVALADAFPGAGLENYSKVGNTRAIVVTDLTTGTATAESTQVSLYVDTVPTEVQSVEVLYYVNATGKWEVLPASVDPVTKVVTFTAPGSGTAQVIVR